MEIENGTCEKLLGVHFDNRLTFDYHISVLCKKLVKNWCTNKSQLIHELKKSRNECFLWFPIQVLSTDSRTNKSKIDRLHERCFRFIYNDK